MIDRRTFLLSTAATLLAGNWTPARAQEQGGIEDWSGVTPRPRGGPPPSQKYQTPARPPPLHLPRVTGLGQWALQTRDVEEDYRTIYGEAPPSPHAIALSIDTNDTRSTAETLFGRIAFIPR